MKKKLTPNERLIGGMKNYKISDEELRIIKILNFINYHKELLEIKDISIIKDLLLDDIKLNQTEKVNWISHVFIKLSEVVFEEYKGFVSHNYHEKYEVQGLGFIFSDTKDRNLIHRNWLALLLLLFRNFKKFNVLTTKLKHLEEKINNFLLHINKLDLITLCTEENLKLAKILIEILIEICLITKKVNNFNLEKRKEKAILEDQYDKLEREASKPKRVQKMKEIEEEMKELSIKLDKNISDDVKEIFSDSYFRIYVMIN